MEESSGRLSMGSDYVDTLRTLLTNLRGIDTLIYELVQNADDARATSMRFEICDDALIVENSAVFTDCGQQENHEECPWKDDPRRGYRCDFHSFRRTAGRNKPLQEDKTGAFGIGFISVYQITDHPELISANRHWVLYPEDPEQDRIHTSKPGIEIAGTRFILPWVFGDTLLRRRLEVEAVKSDFPQRIHLEISLALPKALLFVHHLSRVDIQTKNALHVIQRKCHKEHVAIDEDGTVTNWYLLEGKFDNDPVVQQALRNGWIEHKRPTSVVLALPQTGVENEPGRYHATLPTQQSTLLPLHINSSFFPASDRKSISLDKDFKGDWNRAAIRAATRVLAEALPQLPQLMGHSPLWKMLTAAKNMFDHSYGDSVFREFWLRLEEKIPSTAVVYTSNERWVRPADAKLLQDEKTERVCLPVLEQLGLDIVHPDLNDFSNTLRWKKVGVEYFTTTHLAKALQAVGLDKPVEVAKAPNWIRTRELHDILGNEIEILLPRQQSTPAAKAELAKCAIAVTSGGWLCPPEKARQADLDTAEVFEALEPDFEKIILADGNPTAIAGLVKSFDVKYALRALSQLFTPEDFKEIWQDDPNTLLDVIDWFAQRRYELVSDISLLQQLRELSLWPSGDSVYPLNRLVVPGNFRDPLKLATIVDDKLLDRCHDFLVIDLSANELTIVTYAGHLVPDAFRLGRDISIADRRNLVEILARELNNYRGRREIQDALAQCPLIECYDGMYRAPARQTVYFDTESVNNILSGQVPFATVLHIPNPSDAESVRDFQGWLGVMAEPRPGDIIERIKSLTHLPPTDRTRRTVQKVFTYLGQNWLQFQSVSQEFAPLKTLAWLPVQDDLTAWYSPSDERVFAIYRKTLFESQAKFLDVEEQERLRDFMRYLEIKVNPTAVQVVAHIIEWARTGREVKGVYSYLNTEFIKELALSRLKGKSCLPSEDGRLVRPEDAYVGAHPYGRYRARLRDDVRGYSDLLRRLDVHPDPVPEDAIKVLLEIGEAYTANHESLDAEAKRVVAVCWQMLEQATVDSPSMSEALGQLRDQRVILNRFEELYAPERILIEDRPRIAQKYRDYLARNLISRQAGITAMEYAGVRPLSDCVDTTLVEDSETSVDSSGLRDHFLERARLIDRVLQNSAMSAETQIGQLKVQEVAHLQVEYSIRRFNRNIPPLQEQVFAYFDKATRAFYVQVNQSRPWADIARELAYALAPQQEAKEISSALKEVLSADTTDLANAALDALEFAVFDTPSVDLVSIPGTEQPPKPAEMTELGSTVFPSPEATSTVGESTHTATGLGRATPSESEPQTGTTGRKEPLSRATKSGDGQRGDHPWPPGDSKASAVHIPKERGNQAGKFVTFAYTAHKDNEQHPKDGFTGEPVNLRVDRAGIDRVLEYESVYRRPQEMPHNHPGYDIESYNKTSQEIERYIEVKSLTSTLGEKGATLSDTQFREALLLGDKYWLYIVERAEQPDYNIIRIQDPANQVDYFCYDDGWRQLGEPATEATLKPVSHSTTPHAIRDLRHLLHAEEGPVSLPVETSD